MCGRRCHRRRRAPVVVVLGRLAYQKYQEHQANKLIAGSSQVDSPVPQCEQTRLPIREGPGMGFTAAVTEKTPIIDPPSYEAVVNEKPTGLHREVSIRSQGSDSSLDSEAGEAKSSSWGERKAAKAARKVEKVLMKADRKAEKAYRKAERKLSN